MSAHSHTHTYILRPTWMHTYLCTYMLTNVHIRNYMYMYVRTYGEISGKMSERKMSRRNVPEKNVLAALYIKLEI